MAHPFGGRVLLFVRIQADKTHAMPPKQTQVLNQPRLILQNKANLTESKQVILLASFFHLTHKRFRRNEPMQRDDHQMSFIKKIIILKSNIVCCININLN